MNKLRSVDTGTWSFHSSEEVPHISREEEEEKNKSLGWSIVATDSMSDDDRNSSFLDPMIVWTRSQSRTQKVLYGLGALAIGFIVASSILVFQKWGLSSESSSSSSSSSSTSNVSTPSSSSANEDLSSNPTGTSPLLWKTKRPTAEPLTAPSFPPHLNIYPHMNLPPHLEFSTSSPTAAPEIKQPTTSPTKFQPPTYVPGNLTTLKLDLLLSDGLDARILATAGAKVEYDKSVGGGGKSKDKFHGQPDAGATFSDVRPENPGGWIYVSNSEIDNNKGGVGALTFDKDGNLLDYKIVLKGSSMNCGGGRTPWDTWVSCEELEFTGQIYQVDPTGQREPEVMTLGSDGGRWESFAYDIRDLQNPRFFATEDHNKGTIRRFTPSTVDWDHSPWHMLHSEGHTDFLMITPNAANNGGVFEWTDDLEAAKMNAKKFYPQTEGIDVYGSQLFFVCKNIRQLFVLNMDDGTYYNRTTVNGLFDGKPDQMQRLLGDSRDLLYFTEEGGADSGVHGRDHLGRYYTIFESPTLNDETTGLAFSPDGHFMYVAYQNTGVLFAIWRTDGLPFHASHLDVKYHHGG